MLQPTMRLSLEGQHVHNLGGFARPGAVDQWQAGATLLVGQRMFRILISTSVLTTADFTAAGTLRTGVDSNIRLGFNLVRDFDL